MVSGVRFQVSGVSASLEIQVFYNCDFSIEVLPETSFTKGCESYPLTCQRNSVCYFLNHDVYMKERYVDLFFHVLLCPAGHGCY
jgi:hypothetical protein